MEGGRPGGRPPALSCSRGAAALEHSPILAEGRGRGEDSYPSIARLVLDGNVDGLGKRAVETEELSGITKEIKVRT